MAPSRVVGYCLGKPRPRLVRRAFEAFNIIRINRYDAGVGGQVDGDDRVPCFAVKLDHFENRIVYGALHCAFFLGNAPQAKAECH
jgi:hypothetical protein